MNIRMLGAGAVGALAVTGLAHAAAVTDTVEAGPGNFFVPTDAQKYDSPYYRYGSDDWGWTHNAIAGTIDEATLNISAFDVDFDSGEADEIWAWDSGDWVSLGFLTGANDTWEFGNAFVLGSNFFDDIATGLQVKVDIDKNNGAWALTLGKSALAVNGGALPDPTPGGAVPEPATWAMMIMGAGAVGSMVRRRRVTGAAA